MILNYIWIGLILLALFVSILQAAFFDCPGVFSEVLNSMFFSAKDGFEISLGLTGVLALWMGIMKIGEQAGAVSTLSRIVAPFFHRIFPEIPKNHPVFGTMLMNISANMLGIDNAATPMGLKAMNELQELNKDKSAASNAMIMFVVLGASGLTLVPTTIMAYRLQMGAAEPADIFLPILLATFVATLVGFLSVCAVQRIKIWDRVILSTLVAITALMAGVVWVASSLPQHQLSQLSSGIAAVLLLGIVAWFIIQAMVHRVNVYDAFIEGAKGGFQVAIGIVPYLIAILVAVGMFRASGAMDILENMLRACFEFFGWNPDMAGAIPTAIMKPLSGSGARGMMLEAMRTQGADSLVGRICCVLQGTTDTTFYVLAVYFGSVKIKNTRHAVACCLLADLAGVIAAFVIGNIFFG